MRTYVDYVYEIVKEELKGFEAIYEDYIINLVGYAGFNKLREYNLLETCGTSGGRQLYVLVDMK